MTMAALVLLILPMLIARDDVSMALTTTTRWSYRSTLVRMIVMIIVIIVVPRILDTSCPRVSAARLPCARVHWRLVVWYLGLEAVVGLRALETLVSIGSPSS